MTGGINVGRVLLGGLVAGIVFNVSEYLLNEKVMKSEMAAVMKSRRRLRRES